MWPLFTTPLAFFGLASLPALVAIYFLRNKPRRQVVSSLMLWIDPRETPEGGIRFERLRTPLLFWLEFLILLLLTLAATGPKLPTGSTSRPLVVVLDDSFSMLAAAPDSPRKRAAEALLEDLRTTSRTSVRLVLAGERPQLLGAGVLHGDEVERNLEGWSCQSPTTALDPAIALAFELGGELASILVLTDHPPNPEPATGRVRWWSFGTPRANWAFVNANRTPGPRGDRVLLEIANLYAESQSTTLRIESGDPPQELRHSELRLNGFETHRVVLELPEGTPRIRASLDNDDLSIDNAVTLLPAARKSVRYEVRLTDPKLRTLVERAIKSTAMATPADGRPHLVVYDSEERRPEADESWGLRILVEPDAEAFTGPFVLDRAHPLVEGLSLSGVVWGGGKSPLPGSPVVMAGNVSLLSDAESPSGRHDLNLRLRPDLSTLIESPAWPSLMWNLVQWRAAHLPGLDRANVRVGQEATWTSSDAVDVVEFVRPGGETTKLPVHGRRVAVRADRPGIYVLRAGAESVEIAANLLARDESDLTGCASGKWGEEPTSTAPGFEYREITWILVLLALGVFVLYGVMFKRWNAPPA